MGRNSNDMGTGDNDDDYQRSKAEQYELDQNRRAVLERKRQWEVVDSDNENNNDVEVDDDDGQHMSQRKQHRRHSLARSKEKNDDDSSRHRSKKHKRRHKHHERRDSSSEESIDDRSSRDKLRKSRHHHKKNKKRHKDSNDRKHHKSSRKSKRRRRDSSDSSAFDKKIGNEDQESYESSSLSETEREVLEKSTRLQRGNFSTNLVAPSSAMFGKYGIISYPSDFHKERIRRSFEQWLSEIKAIAAFTGPKHEYMEYFKEYAEDYNTATLPHEKYYDYDKWEMEDYERRKQEAANLAGLSGGEPASTAALDEFRHQELMAQRAKGKRLEKLKRVQQGMTAEKREEMKHQARLRHELSVAYKTGDMETKKKLQRRLEPEDR